MKIAYLDLNDDDFFEDYSYNPKNYGGGRIIAAAILEKKENFHIFGNSKCFDNVKENKKNQCFNLSSEDRKKLKNNFPIKKIIDNISDYDIIFHHISHVSINRDGCEKTKEVVWPIGWRETVNPKVKYILAFDRKFQETQYPSESKVFDIVIGPKFPEIDDLKKYEKEDFIFQCSRHCATYQSIAIAQLCNKYNIKCYFAGPIDSQYPFLNHIDNKNTFYLGIISDGIKKEFLKKSIANIQIQNYPISATLAGKEAAAYGNLIMATKIGGWNDFIVSGENGFFINDEQDFINSWNKRNEIKPENCYKIASKHSEEMMIETTIENLKKILND